MRTALITGASRGIGFGIAEALAGLGFAMTVTARDPDRLERAAEALRDAGSPAVHATTGEMSELADVDRIADEHRDRFGSLDALVVNAGVGTAGPIEKLSMTRFDKIFSVGVRAPFRLVQRTLPLLRSAAEANPAQGARVLVLSSIAGVYAEPGLAAYGSAKASLISLVATLNAEESAGGVSATALSPGYVDTDMSAWTRDRVPQDRMIPVSDIARIAEALVSMSARTVIPNVVLSRADSGGYEA